MPNTGRFLVAVLLVGVLVSTGHAQSVGVGGTTASVTCDSTTVPDQLVDNLNHGVWVANPASSTVTIWVAEVASAGLMTVAAGVPIAPGNAFLFTPSDGWHGALFCLTDAAGSVSVRVNRR